MSARRPASPMRELDKAAIAPPPPRRVGHNQKPAPPVTKPPYARRRGAGKRRVGFRAPGFANLSSDAGQPDYRPR